jgi:DnaK suppressor protein
MDGVDTVAIEAQLRLDEQRTVEQIALLEERAREMQTPGEVAFSSGETLADEAPLATEREVELALRRTLQGRLLDVRRALQKLERGTYGRCESCDQPIIPQRLRAQPHTALCLTCQAKSERARSR